jgi:hypothetical protein
MTITLTIPEEKKAELERLAAAAGTDLEAFILDAVEEKLESRNGALYDRPYAEWSREYRQWVASHTSRNPSFDDSRESIYD